MYAAFALQIESIFASSISKGERTREECVVVTEELFEVVFERVFEVVCVVVCEAVCVAVPVEVLVEV